MTTSAEVKAPRRVRVEVDRRDRWRSLTWLAVAAVLIAFALALFGLPPVDLHAPPHYAGYMDPFCGGTRAIRLAAMGDWQASWRYNPIGVPLFLAFVLVIVRAAVGWTTGRWVTVRIDWTRRGRAAAWLVLIVLLIVLDINQQLHADLLMSDSVS